MDEGTDYWAIKQGYISVTPLQMDMINKALLEILDHPMG
jgi:broad specificity polyphosphatase/5'/3'-nucleotidase SurE